MKEPCQLQHFCCCHLRLCVCLFLFCFPNQENVSTVLVFTVKLWKHFLDSENKTKTNTHINEDDNKTTVATDRVLSHNSMSCGLSIFFIQFTKTKTVFTMASYEYQET